MAADAGDDEGFFFGDFVEVQAGGEFFFAEFVVVEAVAVEPAGGAAKLELAEAGEDVVDGLASDEVGLAEEHFAVGVEVDVGVDEAGGDGFVLKVDVTGCGVFFQFGVGADGQDPAVFDGHGCGGGKMNVEGEEVAIG